MTWNSIPEFGLVWTNGMTNYMKFCSEVMSCLTQYTKLTSDVAETYIMTNDITMKKYEKLYSQFAENLSKLELT